MAKSNKREYVKNYIKQRIANNANCVIVIIGGTGSGKSCALLDLLADVDPLINHSTLKDHIGFTPVRFLEIVSKRPPKGYGIIYDESGVGMNSRTSMSKTNIAQNNVFQTFRNLNYIIGLTLPSLAWLDKVPRSLVHVIIVMQPKMLDRKNKISYGKPYIVEVNPFTSKGWGHHLNTPDQQVVKLMRFRLPDEKLLNEYEQLKSEFQDELYKQQIEYFKGMEHQRFINAESVEASAWSEFDFTLKNVPDSRLKKPDLIL